MGPKSVKKARDLRSRLSSPEFQAERSRDVWSCVTRTDGGDFDLELICADNDRVPCHQFVLAKASRFLCDLIKTNSIVMLDSSLRSYGPLVISLPEVGGYGVRGVLSMLYNGFTEFPHSESSLASQIKEAYKVLKIDVFKLNNRSSVKVVKMEDISDSAQYQERKSFENLEVSTAVPAEPVKRNNKNPDILSSIDEALELEEVSPGTPRDRSKIGEQRKLTKEIVVVSPKARPASGGKRKISPVGVSDSETVRGKESSEVQPAKKSKMTVRGAGIGVAYSVEKIHTCVICNGKTPEGRIDREASNLSFGELKRLKEHYSKHFYSEGKIFQAFPPDEENLDSEGKIKDQVK